MYGGEGKCIWGFSGKPEGKSPLGRPKHRWEYIKMFLKEIGWEGVDCINLYPANVENMVSSYQC